MTADFKPFPVELLPEPIRRYVTEAAESMRVDPSYVAVALLPALASAIGNSRRIMLKADRPEPAVLWAALIGDSGTRKSKAISAAHAPIHARQTRLEKEYAKRQEQYESDSEEWKIADKAERGPAPDPPAPMEHCIVNDATTEGVADRLGRRGMLWAADELSQTISGLNQYKSKGAGNDRDRLLGMYDAGWVKIDRKTGDRRTIIVPRAAVSIAGGTQPEILRRVFRAEYFDCGFVARFLWAMPPGQPALWTDRVISDRTRVAVGKLFDGLFDLAGMIDSDGQPCPLDLPLTADALPEFVEFQNAEARAAQDKQADRADAAALAKLPGQAARLALVIHCVRHVAGGGVDAWCVDRESIVAGIGLAGWFKGEFQRVYDLFASDPAAEGQEALIDFIDGRGGQISVRALQRDGPRRYRSGSSTALAALQRLEDDGFGAIHDPSQTGRGRPGSKYFTLSNCHRRTTGDGDNKAAGGAGNGNFVASGGDKRPSRDAQRTPNPAPVVKPAQAIDAQRIDGYKADGTLPMLIQKAIAAARNDFMVTHLTRAAANFKATGELSASLGRAVLEAADTGDDKPAGGGANGNSVASDGGGGK